MSKGNPKTWYKQKKNGFRGAPCAAPYKNVFIGSDPLDGMTVEKANSFDAIVNVSCSECALFYPSYDGQAMYWIPVNEMGVWNYSAFVQFIKVMNFHHKKKHKIYVHCHAGAYRSPTMTMIWMFIKGSPLKYEERREVWKLMGDDARNFEWNEAYRMAHGYTVPEYYDKYEEDPYRLTYFRGNMPPNFEEFIARIKEAESNKRWSEYDWNYVGMLDGSCGPISKDREVRAKVQGWKTSEKIKRFFIYKPKSKWRDLKEWWKHLKQGKKQVVVRRSYNSASRTTAILETEDLLRTVIRHFKSRKATRKIDLKGPF